MWHRGLHSRECPRDLSLLDGLNSHRVQIESSAFHGLSALSPASHEPASILHEVVFEGKLRLDATPLVRGIDSHKGVVLHRWPRHNAALTAYAAQTCRLDADPELLRRKRLIGELAIASEC